MLPFCDLIFQLSFLSVESFQTCKNAAIGYIFLPSMILITLSIRGGAKRFIFTKAVLTNVGIQCSIKKAPFVKSSLTFPNDQPILSHIKSCIIKKKKCSRLYETFTLLQRKGPGYIGTDSDGECTEHK